jgi:hypothetical protein
MTLESVKKLGPHFTKLMKKMKKHGYSNSEIVRKIGDIMVKHDMKLSPSSNVVKRYVLAKLAESKGVKIRKTPEMNRFKQHKRFLNNYVATHKNQHGIPVDLNAFRKNKLKQSRVKASNLRKLHTLSNDNQLSLLFQFVSQPKQSLLSRYPDARARRQLALQLRSNTNYHKVLRNINNFNPNVEDAFPKAKILLNKFSRTKSDSDALLLSSLIADLKSAKKNDSLRVRDKIQKVLMHLKGREPNDLTRHTSS